MRNDLLQVQLRRNDIESQRVKLQNGISIVRQLLAQYCGLKASHFTVEAVTDNVIEARQQLDIAQRSIEQSKENLRLNRDYYHAGTSKMSDLLEAQLLYQQSLDRRTDAYADLQNKLLEYRQATGQTATGRADW